MCRILKSSKLLEILVLEKYVPRYHLFFSSIWGKLILNKSALFMSIELLDITESHYYHISKFFPPQKVTNRFSPRMKCQISLYQSQRLHFHFILIFLMYKSVWESVITHIMKYDISFVGYINLHIIEEHWKILL